MSNMRSSKRNILVNITLLNKDIQCVIYQEIGTIAIPFKTPSFLKTINKTQCQTHDRDHKKLRCGQTEVFIKPECVCSFYNVYEATLYHRHSFCPDGATSDKVTQLKCSDCKKYSLKNNGPCINGGKLTCKGDEVAPEVTCQCPPNFEGRLCEIKIENITRICNMISEPPPHDLENCNTTWKECVTYSRNELYAYKCEEANTSKDTQGYFTNVVVFSSIRLQNSSRITVAVLLNQRSE
uniref:Uncharacterized protein LOC111114321 n=1 Tax=Crassostrea virginica TaxID=6565 RepID=A0A8B8BZP5_CRAVI|nr:uncharacterized protein LOC111114321 [Crassostrea virginica]